jgi:hypothetical protein
MFEALTSDEKFYEFFIEIKKSIFVSFSFLKIYFYYYFLILIQHSNRKVIYFSCLTENDLKIYAKIFKELGEFEQEYNLFKTKDHRNYLDQCDMALLIKHERNLKSKYLRKEIEYLNKNNRLFLLILMDKKIISENLMDLNSFNVIVLDDSLNLAERTENIKRFKLLIEQSLNMFEKKHKPIELKFNLIKTIDSERSRLIQKEKVDLIENEIIIRISDKILKYFNIQTKKLILEIRVDSIITGFCLIKHLQQLLVITRSNTTFIASFYSKTGEFLLILDLSNI